MQKTIFLAFAVLFTMIASANANSFKPGIVNNPDIITFKNIKDPCVVTVNNIQNSWTNDCSGNVVLLRVTGTCSKSNDNCDVAYTQARDCANSDAAAKMATAKADVVKGCLLPPED